MMKPRLALAAALSALALGAAGCAQAATPATPPATSIPAPQATDTPTSDTPSTSVPATPDSPGAATTSERNAAALRAITTAEQAVNGTAYEIDDEDDNDEWEVDVMVGDRSVEVKVSADGHRVVSQSDDDDDDNDDRARLQRATVSLSQAIEIALREVPGTLDDVELDDENGQDVWEVKIDTPGDDDVKVYVSTTEERVIRIDR